MAYKTKTEKTKYTSYQRRSLLNSRGYGPRTQMKPYDVSIYEYNSQPARVTGAHRTSYSSPWVPIDGEIDPLSYGDVGRFDVTNASFFYQPLGLSYAREVDDQAHAALRARVSKMQDDKLNAAVFVSELGSTMRMFANTAIRVNRSFRALRRGNLKEAWASLGLSYAPRRKGGKDLGNPLSPSNVRVDDRTVSGRASNLLLEYSYGLIPLMSDIDAACHKLATSTIQRPPVLSARGGASQKETKYYYLRDGVVMKVSTELSMMHTLQYRVSSDLISHAASLGFTNPMLLIYEATPLSFVLDWFSNVGEWLKAFSTFHGLEYVQGCTSAKGSTETSVTYAGSQRTGTVGYSYYDSSGALRNEQHPGLIENTSGSAIWTKSSGMTRTLWAGFPSLPPLRLSLPDKGLAKKFAVSLALLRQRRSALGPFDKLFS